MKNPHLLCNTWNRSINSSKAESVLMSVPGTNKKLKRKSSEPKRLLSCTPEPDRTRRDPADTSCGDSGDEAQAERRHVGVAPSGRRQLLLPQELLPAAGAPEGHGAAAQSCAIDMRIGSNVPAITAKLSQAPAPSFPGPEMSPWSSSRLKLGLRSTFPPPSSMSSGCHSPLHPGFSLDPSLSGPPAALLLPRAPQTPQSTQHAAEPPGLSPQESPRKRAGLSGDLPGRLPEVKAVQQTRRLLANARERTRVHTISAAFEALRKQVPCYSYGQKLSKLAILRIACNYILSLAQLAELDYSSDHSSQSFTQCVEQCTRTLQAEGRSKKRKE
ncbi:transcription factor atoh8 [Genypterus blacodes]|uniref:transcription factor atoh8 n=1 Tax=Genypterus blacodes TaxID=154954 RepID=UPI003F764F95